jgi:hypothetical protein
VALLLADVNSWTRLWETEFDEMAAGEVARVSAVIASSLRAPAWVSVAAAAAATGLA